MIMLLEASRVAFGNNISFYVGFVRDRIFPTESKVTNGWEALDMHESDMRKRL